MDGKDLGCHGPPTTDLLHYSETHAFPQGTLDLDNVAPEECRNSFEFNAKFPIDANFHKQGHALLVIAVDRRFLNTSPTWSRDVGRSVPDHV